MLRSSEPKKKIEIDLHQFIAHLISEHQVEIDLRRFVRHLISEQNATRQSIVAYFLSNGKRISEIADTLGMEYFQLYRFIQNENLSGHMTARHGRRLNKKTLAEIKRLLLQKGLTPREIERQLGLASRHPIYCMIAQMRREAEKTAGEFQPRATTETRRCPKHGLVNVWPCVACAAEIGDVPAAEVEDDDDDEDS